MADRSEKKSSLLVYVGNLIQKQDNQPRDEENGADPSTTPMFDKSSVAIRTRERDPQQNNVDNRSSGSTDIDYDELSFGSDPVVETHEGGGETYKQSVYLRQYQPSTPDSLDIQVQETLLKPRIQRPPIHVYIEQSQNRDGQRTSSPILVQSAPPEPPSNERIVYNKYIPIDKKPLSRQIVIHRYPEVSPKPRPIVVEQWLPNKPPSKRITYRHVNRDELLQNEATPERNRYIEYEKPRVIVQVEIIRLPIVKLDPNTYSTKLTKLIQLDQIRSVETLRWRI